MSVFSKITSLGEDWPVILAKYKDDNDYVTEFKCFKKDLRYKGHKNVLVYKSAEFQSCKSTFIDQLNKDILNVENKNEPALLIHFQDYELGDILDFLEVVLNINGKIKKTKLSTAWQQDKEFADCYNNSVSNYVVTENMYRKEEGVANVYLTTLVKTGKHTSLKSPKQCLLSKCESIVREQLQKINLLYKKLKLQQQKNLTTLTTFEDSPILSRVFKVFEILSSQPERKRCGFCKTNKSVDTTEEEETFISSCQCSLNVSDTACKIFKYIWRTAGDCPFDQKVFGFPMNHIKTPIKELADLSGVTTSYDYIGLALSLFALHCEDLFGCNSINFNYLGAAKIWYCIHPLDYNKLNKNFYQYISANWKKSGGNPHKSCILKHKEYFVDPELFQKWGVRYTVLIQEPGMLVATKTNCFHEGFNLDFNYCRAVNVILSDFVDTFADADHEWDCNCTDSTVSTAYQRVQRTEDKSFDHFLITMLKEKEYPIQLQPYFGTERDWKKVSNLFYAAIEQKSKLNNAELIASKVHTELLNSVKRLANITTPQENNDDTNTIIHSNEDSNKDSIATMDQVRFLSEQLEQLTLKLEKTLACKPSNSSTSKIVSSATRHIMETCDEQEMTDKDCNYIHFNNALSSLSNSDLPANFIDSFFSDFNGDDDGCSDSATENIPQVSQINVEGAEDAYFSGGLGSTLTANNMLSNDIISDNQNERPNKRQCMEHPYSVQNITVNVPPCTGTVGNTPCIININSNSNNNTPTQVPTGLTVAAPTTCTTSTNTTKPQLHHVCEYCKGGFNGRFRLAKHLFQKHKFFMYRCNTCPDYGTYKEKDMGMHMQSVHNMIPNAYTFEYDTQKKFFHCKTVPPFM